ncbi:HEAT repeat domain-containing protein [Pendulispora brunnea]|uniref:HEAT repeat domain-containing protein n=1 Tax=Pendulispora brunnea TaxID=2905690 RepID=A0ABZ2KKZ7_9BACT
MKKTRTPDAIEREKRLDEAIAQSADGLFELLLESISDVDSEVRETAAYGLGELADARGIPLLIELVERDVDEKVVLHALVSMESFRDSRIHQCLLREAVRIRATRSPRQHVARQLRWYDSQESVDALRALLTQDDALVSQLAEESLIVLRPAERELWERIVAGGKS